MQKHLESTDIDTAGLRERLDAAREQDAVPVGGAREELGPFRARGGGLLCDDGVADLAELGVDERKIGAVAVEVQSLQDREGVVRAGMFQQVARGLGQEKNPKRQEDGGKHLDRQGKSPREGALRLGAAIADPLLG